jgi:hypothetical protein
MFLVQRYYISYFLHPMPHLCSCGFWLKFLEIVQGFKMTDITLQIWHTKMGLSWEI